MSGMAFASSLRMWVIDRPLLPGPIGPIGRRARPLPCGRRRSSSGRLSPRGRSRWRGSDSIGFVDLREAWIAPRARLRIATLTRRAGEASTARGTEMPPNCRRVTSSRGAAFSTALTRSCSGFCFSLLGELLEGEADGAQRLRLLAGELPALHEVVREPLDQVHVGLHERPPGELPLGVRRVDRVQVEVRLRGPGRGPRCPRRRTSRRAGGAGSGGGGGGAAGRTTVDRVAVLGILRAAVAWDPGVGAHRCGFSLRPRTSSSRETPFTWITLYADTGDVAVRPTHASADPLDEHLVVLVDEVDGAVAHREGGDLTAVLDQLDLDALADRRVRLLRLDADLLDDDPAALGGPLERVRALLEVEGPSLVVAVRPASPLAERRRASQRCWTPDGGAIASRGGRASGPPYLTRAGAARFSP